MARYSDDNLVHDFYQLLKSELMTSGRDDLRSVYAWGEIYTSLLAYPDLLGAVTADIVTSVEFCSSPSSMLGIRAVDAIGCGSCQNLVYILRSSQYLPPWSLYIHTLYVETSPEVNDHRTID